MPTVLRYGSMRFQIYAGNEHEPPHVHVLLPHGEVVVILEEQSQAATVRKATRNIRSADIPRILAVVTEHFETLLDVWSLYHR
ncbi:MAG: hypothetical protein QOJ39_1821 [Candidatus Eremiobacteraeota bacterium]|jgi:hypothetical protein|nr:hypothetical protein [Candidatus Eremiobacteraeota bacterium]